MDKKLTKLGLILFSLVPLASAQSFEGVVPLITDIIGIEGNITNLLGFLATLGFINFTVYVFFKVLFKSISEKTDLVSERTFFGGSDGRNLVAILSVLFTFSGVFGAGAAGIINGFQSVIILALVMALIAFLAVVLLGGGGAALGSIPFAGGAGVRAAAKGVKEGGKQLGADSVINYSREKINSAQESITSGEQDAEEGDLQSAEQKFERVIELLEDVAPKLGQDFEDMEQELEDAKQELLDVEDHKRGSEASKAAELNSIEDLDTRLERTREFLIGIIDGKGTNTSLIYNPADSEDEFRIRGAHDVPGDYDADEIQKLRSDTSFDHGLSRLDVEIPVGYNLQALEEDVKQIEKDINIIQRDYEGYTGEFADAVREFEDATERAIRIHSLLENHMIPLLEELEEDSEEMEAIESNRKLEKLHNATSDSIREEAKIEDIVDKLETYSSDIKSKIDDVLGEVEHILEYDEREINDLKQALGWAEGLGEAVDEAFKAAYNSREAEEDSGGPANLINALSGLQSDFQTLYNQIKSIHDQLEKIEKEFDEEEKNVAGQMSQMFSDIDSNPEKEQIAIDVGNDIQSWLSHSRFGQKRTST